MKHLQLASIVVLLSLLVACGGRGITPTPNPTPGPTPGTGTPTLPPDTTPVNPTPTPTPDGSNIPYYGEWIITYTSDLGTSFVHALEVTTDLSSEDLHNGGGGFQEFCTGGDRDECEGVYGSGIGFIGNLVLDDGTSPLTLAIATSYGGATPELKLVTIEDIQMTTNAQNQQTFTADAAWFLTPDDVALGTITATNVGAPKILEPLTLSGLQVKAELLVEQAKGIR